MLAFGLNSLLLLLLLLLMLLPATATAWKKLPWSNCSGATRHDDSVAVCQSVTRRC
jgi:hypothetical protein